MGQFGGRADAFRDAASTGLAISSVAIAVALVIAVLDWRRRRDRGRAVLAHPAGPASET